MLTVLMREIQYSRATTTDELRRELAATQGAVAAAEKEAVDMCH